MKEWAILPWVRIGTLAALLLCGASATGAANRGSFSGAAKRYNVPATGNGNHPGARPSDRAAPPKAATLRTNPASITSETDWDRYVRTQMPRFGKIDLGPFAVRQNRLFEQGQVRTPASVNTF